MEHRSLFVEFSKNRFGVCISEKLKIHLDISHVTFALAENLKNVHKTAQNHTLFEEIQERDI